VELLVAMVLLAIASVAIYRLITGNQRAYRQQAERVDLNQNVRAAMSLLPSEIRELNAGDVAGSDILSMSATSIAYRAARSLYFVCQTPNPAVAQVIVGVAPFFGMRQLDPAMDRIMIYAENDPTTRTDNQWFRGDLTGVTNGTACPGGGASVTLTFSGLAPALLVGVLAGAPVRGYQVVQLSLYSDPQGAWWLGTNAQNKATNAWSTIEPIAGPLTTAGLQLTYFDSTGAVTAILGNVQRVGITVTGRTLGRVRAASGAGAYDTTQLVTQAALRNNPRY